MFEWNEKYSVGVEKIDEQHKRLFDLGYKTYDILKNTDYGIDQYDQIKILLKELFDYTVFHFESEESILKEYDYVSLPTHRFQHKLFMMASMRYVPYKTFRIITFCSRHIWFLQHYRRLKCLLHDVATHRCYNYITNLLKETILL